MHLTKISISNYRCFDSLEIDFDRHLTVLVAPNGQGKTTVLDALRVAVWPFVKGFDLGSQTGKGATIQIPDVRLAKLKGGNMEPQVPSRIEAVGAWDAPETRQWVQTRERVKRGTNTSGDAPTKELTRWAGSLERRARGGDPEVILPLVTYLGTSRLWFQGRFTSNAKEVSLGNEDYSRTSGYLNCLSYSSSFPAFKEWYGWVYRSYREEQIQTLESNGALSEEGERFKKIIAVIKDAVDALVEDATGWHDLEYSSSQNQQLIMRHGEFGTIPVDMLSDGMRNAIAMVADLAFRMAKLNPHLGKEARQTPGIALIDEVDMFLHPSWQQRILPSLRKAFPNVQFIVSTHSPQVLTTVGRDNIRLLGQRLDGTWHAPKPEQEIIGVESAVALNDIMHVNPIPPVEEADWLAKYTVMIESGSHESNEGKELRRILERVYGPRHPLILDVDRLIRFQAMKLKNRSGE
ncbi:AAA family ATPase [Rhodospirillum sp. A1_3_36]|uniref:AAA family ATPase n=1 Tax=Rhodospirillum sp. A1_3_36 TaxID=3391666 RepID=UPI0039A52021